jgi:hypothetical protein
LRFEGPYFQWRCAQSATTARIPQQRQANMEPLYTILRHIRQGEVTKEEAIQALAELKDYLNCGYERIALVPIESILRKEELTKLLLNQVQDFARTQSSRFRRHIRFEVSYFIFRHYFEPQIKAIIRARRRKDRIVVEFPPCYLEAFANLSEIFPFKLKSYGNQYIDLYRGKRGLFSLAYDHKNSCGVLTVSLGFYFRNGDARGHVIAHPRYETDLH